MSAAERRLPLTLAAWDAVEAALRPLTPRERLMLLEGMRERLEASPEVPRYDRARHLGAMFPWMKR
jgi:hypothetical protein